MDKIKLFSKLRKITAFERNKKYYMPIYNIMQEHIIRRICKQCGYECGKALYWWIKVGRPDLTNMFNRGYFFISFMEDFLQEVEA